MISLFTALLNAAFFLILLWYFYVEFKQFIFNHKIKNRIPVNYYSQFKDNVRFNVLVFAYIAVVTFLWILSIFGESQMVDQHWFAYVFPLIILTTLTFGQMKFSIGDKGVYVKRKIILWSEVENFRLKESISFHNKFQLEIKAGNQIFRGAIPDNLKQPILDLFRQHRIEEA